MARRILIIEGHPDPAASHFNAALAEAYARGAREGGHEIRRLKVGELDFPVPRDVSDWSSGLPPAAISEAQAHVRWAEHLVILYPLWLGDMPALLKGFFEQIARPGFAFLEESGGFPKGLLGGRSARVIVTMGMPAFIYHWYFHAHSLKSLQHNILEFVGIRPVRTTVIGMVEASADARAKQLVRVQNLGRKGI